MNEELEGQAERDDPDLLVPGAPISEGDTPLTVLALLEEMREEWDRQKPLLAEAEFRERMVLGEQWRARDPTVERSLGVMEGNTEGNFITENLLYPLSLTWTARVNQGRIEPRAYPFHPTPSDMASAKAANAVIDYEKQKIDVEDLIAQAGQYAQYHGDVLFYPTWDDADGPYLVRRQKTDEFGPVFDMQTKQPVMEEAMEWGGVRQEIVAAPDYCTSGQQHYKDAEWMFVRRVIPQKLAEMRLRQAGFFNARPKVAEYPVAFGYGENTTTRRGVECFEMWLKKGARTTTGAFMLVVDKWACQAKSLTKKFDEGTDRATERVAYRGQLPGGIWKIGEIRGSSRGKTHVSDAIHQQRLVNETLRAVLARAVVARSANLFAPSAVMSDLGSADSHRIANDQDEADKKTFWIAGPDIPPGLFQTYERARRALHDVFGISEATVSGGDPSQTKSGQQLRDATALDAQKIAPARRALEKCLELVVKQWLQLWQDNAEKARLVRVLGPDGEVAADYFESADLMGADVALEITSGVQNTHIAGQSYAEQSAAAGFLNPQAATELRETGLLQTMSDAEALTRVDAQAHAALQGQPQQPLPGVNPKTAIDRLTLIVRSPQASSGNVQGLIALIGAYQQAMQQAAQQAQMQQGPPGQKPNNGPGRMQMPAMGGQPQKGAVTATKFRTEPPESLA